jgi:hypothetical protein
MAWYPYQTHRKMKKLVLVIGIIVAALSFTTLHAGAFDPGKGDKKAKKELKKEHKAKHKEHKQKHKGV